MLTIDLLQPTLLQQAKILVNILFIIYIYLFEYQYISGTRVYLATETKSIEDTYTIDDLD